MATLFLVVTLVTEHVFFFRLLNSRATKSKGIPKSLRLRPVEVIAHIHVRNGNATH